MITKLKNPKTDNYQNVKNHILSNEFLWTYESNVISGNNAGKSTIIENGVSYHNIPFFSHMIIRRPLPSQKYPLIVDQLAPEFETVVNEILEYNDLQLNCIYRMSVNLVQYTSNDPINIKESILQDINIQKQKLLMEIEELRNG